MVTESSTGPRKRFREMSVAHVGVHGWVSPGSLLSGGLRPLGPSQASLSLLPPLAALPGPHTRASRGGVFRKRCCAYRPSVIHLIVNKLFSLFLSLSHWSASSCLDDKVRDVTKWLKAALDGGIVGVPGPAKVLTNLLDINIPTYRLSAELWDKDAAQCAADVIKFLLLNAEMYPLVDPAKKTNHMVQWAFIEEHLLRHAHQHYPSGQTAAAVSLRRAVHDLVKSLFVKIFTPYWPRAEEATRGDYDDDNDAGHMPLTGRSMGTVPGALEFANSESPAVTAYLSRLPSRALARSPSGGRRY